MTTANPYERRDGHRCQPGKNSPPWEAWQAGYEGQPLPPHPWPITGIAKAGDPMDPTSVIGRCYRRGVDARHAEITLEAGQFGWDYILERGDGKTVLIQTDYDYPGLASSFGWAPCPCGATDGTVDCPHKTASDMIAEAGQYLDDNIGATIEDPGYFSE